jgi:DNA-binding SARP family transcriptional activator
MSTGQTPAGSGLTPPSGPGPARLYVLGSFELVFDEDHLHLSQPAQRLLVYLATTYRLRPTRRGALAERLWPQVSPDRATSNLRSLLWRLPRPRGRQLVISDATTVRLAGEVEVDLWEAEQLAALLCSDEAPPREALEDLSVLAEDLLPDWHDDWLVVERESHRQKRLHALERSSAHLRAAGMYNGALTAALCAVTSEPLRESAHRRVIEVHLAEDNHAEALRQFHGYRALLSRELGLAPSPAIRRLVAPLVGRPNDL